MATDVMPKGDVTKSQAVARKKENDWTRPQALAIPKEGYFEYEQGKYGPILPKTPACYGFSVVALPGLRALRWLSDPCSKG